MLSSEEKAPPIWVQGYLCKKHGKFRIQPSLLLPYKHYVACIIEEALETRVTGEAVESFCSRRELWNPGTPRRWIRSFLSRLPRLARKAEQWLLGLRPSWGRERSPPQQEATSWTLASVWNLLGNLQEACLAQGLSVPSRAYLALVV